VTFLIHSVDLRVLLLSLLPVAECRFDKTVSDDRVSNISYISLF